MAPLRSSRSTRNQDHSIASRNRPGVVDLDPTEGLPVQKWEQIIVRVNQDPSSDPSSSTALPSGITATSSAEWAVQFGTPQFPWPEKPLPSFFSQLPPWNQEMLRRARTGNTNAKLSVWDRKTNSWISAAEAEKRHHPLKSVHLNNLEPNTGSKPNNGHDSPAHDDDEDHDDKSDEEIDGDNADDDVGPTTTPGLKRRKKYAPEERIFEVKRWTQMPPAAADKAEERKFLADRRPGMPSLYGGAYQNQIFGSMGLNTNGYGFSAANAGYDLGDGGGLGNAGAMLQDTGGAATPVRKNMPPKRKKKKGGPGRKKANPNPIPQADTNDQSSATKGGQGLDGTIDTNLTGDVTMAEGDNEGSDSGSEGEGSEEGEIDEGGHDNEKPNEHVETPAELDEKLGIEQEAPRSPMSDTTSHVDPGTLISAESTIARAILDASNTEPDAPVDTTPVDTTMQDQPVAEAPISIQPEPEVVLSVVQFPVSEQIPELPLAEVVPAQEQEQIQISEMSEVPEILPPASESQLEPQLESRSGSQPEPQLEPQLTESQPMEPEEIASELVLAEPIHTEQSPSSTTIPGLDTIPMHPTTQLAPITTTVAEAMDQPSTSAPGTEPAAAAPILQNSIPDPISPDLLGGLEDELNKNMGEENVE